MMRFLPLVALLVGFALPAQAAQSDAIARAGEVTLSRDEVAQRIAQLPQAQREQLAKNPQPLEQWLREQLAERMLLQEAAAQQWEKRPEVARDIAAVTQEVVARSYLQSVSQPPEGYPSEAELRAAYNRAKNSLQKPASYRLSQLFFATPAGDEAAQAQARKRAAELVEKAKRPKADFSKLMAEYGKEGNTQAQNDTGWVTLGQLVPEVRPVVARLQTGEVSDPIASPAGLHVLKLVEMREAQPATLAEVRPLLQARMRQERQAQIARAYLDSLANGPTVKVDTKALDGVLKGEATPAAGAEKPKAR